VREAKKMHEEPALMAEVQTTPLMMEGTTEMPPRTKAMTKGDCAAVPVEMEREGSSNRLWWWKRSQQDALDKLVMTKSLDLEKPSGKKGIY
jgi:hypothetical protein